MRKVKNIKKLNIDLNPDFHNAFKSATAKEGRTIKDVFMDFAENYIARVNGKGAVSKRGNRETSNNPGESKSSTGLDNRLARIEEQLNAFNSVLSKAQEKAKLDEKIPVHETHPENLEENKVAKKKTVKKSSAERLKAQNKKTLALAEAKGVKAVFECKDCGLIFISRDGMLSHLLGTEGFSKDEAERMVSGVEARMKKGGSKEEAPKDNPGSKDKKKKDDDDDLLIPWLGF